MDQILEPRTITTGLPRTSARPDYQYAHSVLAELPRKYWARLLEGARSFSLNPGETLFRKDDPSDGFYWLRRGALKVCITGSRGEERILAILGAGATVGELAMIVGEPRVASVHAIADCHLN